MAENNSNPLLDGLKAFNEGLTYINPYQWLGRMSVSNNDYFEKGQTPSNYTSQGNIRRSLTDVLTGVVPQVADAEQNRQITDRLQASGGAKKADDYGIDLKGSDGQLRRVYEIVEDIAEGDTRSAALAENNVLTTDLGLKDGQNFATIQKPLFDTLLRRAATKQRTNQSLVAAGIDPSTVQGTAAANEAIRKKGTQDQIEKETAISDAFEQSAAGQRAQALHADNLKTNQSNRDAQAANTAINQGTLDLARVQAGNTQQLALYDRDVDKYRYEDGKAERAIERQYEADREAARFAAQAETVRLQNDADMERYQLMLENERQKSQGDTISELMASLTMLGGAFMI